MFLVGCKTPLQSFLGIAEQHGGPQNGVSVCQGYLCVEGHRWDQEEASCVDLLSFHNAQGPVGSTVVGSGARETDLGLVIPGGWPGLGD